MISTDDDKRNEMARRTGELTQELLERCRQRLAEANRAGFGHEELVAAATAFTGVAAILRRQIDPDLATQIMEQTAVVADEFAPPKLEPSPEAKAAEGAILAAVSAADLEHLMGAPAETWAKTEGLILGAVAAAGDALEPALAGNVRTLLGTLLATLRALHTQQRAAT